MLVIQKDYKLVPSFVCYNYIDNYKLKETCLTQRMIGFLLLVKDKKSQFFVYLGGYYEENSLTNQLTTYHFSISL